MTREHLWGRWMQEFARHATGHYRFGIAGGRATLREFVAPTFTQTLRRVCRACNNGWMAELEAQMKSVTTRMLSNEGAVLGATEQATLARWMLKTALVIASISEHAATEVDPQHHRAVAAGSMPPNTTVWLGRYEGAELQAGAWVHRFAWEDGDAARQSGNGYFFLVSALTLVGFGIVMGGSGEITPGVELGAPMLASFRRIWPISEHYAVVWPTAPPVTFEFLCELAKQFGRDRGGANPPPAPTPSRKSRR